MEPLTPYEQFQLNDLKARSYNGVGNLTPSEASRLGELSVKNENGYRSADAATGLGMLMYMGIVICSYIAVFVLAPILVFFIRPLVSSSLKKTKIFLLIFITLFISLAIFKSSSKTLYMGTIGKTLTYVSMNEQGIKKFNEALKIREARDRREQLFQENVRLIEHPSSNRGNNMKDRRDVNKTISMNKEAMEKENIIIKAATWNIGAIKDDGYNETVQSTLNHIDTLSKYVDSLWLATINNENVKPILSYIKIKFQSLNNLVISL